jgi:hypothetical protein
MGPSKIAGLTIGLILIVAISVAIYWFIRFKRRQQNRVLSEHDSMQVSGLSPSVVDPGCLDEGPADHGHKSPDSRVVAVPLADRHPIDQVNPSYGAQHIY